MKTLRPAARCLLALVLLGVISPLAVRAGETYPPKLAAFMDKNSPDEAWLGRVEKLAAAIVAAAQKDSSFKDEYGNFLHDETLKGLIYNGRSASDDLLPDDGGLNGYASAKYPKTVQMLKSAGWSAYQYCGVHVIMETYGHLIEAPGNGLTVPDGKHIQAGIAFFKQNLERLEQVGKVVR